MTYKSAVSTFIVTLIDVAQAPKCFEPLPAFKDKAWIANVTIASDGAQVAADIEHVRRWLNSQYGEMDALEAFERIAARLGIVQKPMVTVGGRFPMATLLDAMDAAMEEASDWRKRPNDTATSKE